MPGEFTFGSQYLRGCSPAPENWERDMCLMKTLNFNTIRCWLVWGVLEYDDNKIDFDYIDRFLELSGKYDLKVIMLFHLHGCPEWAVRKYGRYWYADQENRQFEPSPRSNTPSGGWPGLCPDNKEVQELEERFITAVCRHAGTRVEYWEPMNEPHMFTDHARTPRGVYCYCDETRKLFRIWLEKKYLSLSCLEKAWGRRFDCWDSVRPPTWAFGYSDWADWRTFTAENIAALCARRTEIIRRNSDAPVIAHAWGGGTLTCSELGGMAFDDWKNADSTSIWGCSAFPFKIEQTSNIGLCMDGTRSAANGKEFWQAEMGTGDFFGGLNRIASPSPELFRIWCWETIAHGTSGLLFWQFRKEICGNECGCYGLTGYDGKLNEIGCVVQEIGKALKENSALLLQISPVPAEVALLFSFQSYMIDWAEHRSCKLSSDCMSGYYRAFWDKNIPVDILHEERISSEILKKYRMIILPSPLALPDYLVDLLVRYVEEGGTLLSDPFLCAFDENKNLSGNIPGRGLQNLFGCEEKGIQTKSSAFALKYKGEAISLENSFFLESWNVHESDTEIVAVYDDGNAAIIKKRTGLGTTIISGLNLGKINSFGTSVGDELRREATAGTDRQAANIILDFAADANISIPVIADDGFRAKLLVSENIAVLIIFEFRNQKNTASVRLPGKNFKCWRNILSNESGAVDVNSLKLDFNRHETKVLLLS